MIQIAEPKFLISDVSQALDGNQKSYKSLYDYLAPILRKTIQRKIYRIPSHEAKDILQDIFVKLYSKLHSFKPGSSFTAWAIRIAVNHTIDLSRKRKPDVILTGNVETYDCGVSENLVHSYQYETTPMVDVFDLANKYLDKTSKRIIIGKYFVGLKQKEMAEKLNKPIGSMSGLQSLAIEHLKKKVNELRYDRGNFL